MANSLVTTGGIVLADTPDSYENIADLIGPGNTLYEIDSMIIAPQRAPIGFLCFFDTDVIVPGTPSTFWIPVVQPWQLVSFVSLLGAPLAPVVASPPYAFYGWSFDPVSFDPVLVSLPTADIDIVFSLRIIPPA